LELNPLDEKNVNSILRIVLTVAIFFGVLALILPWGQISVGALGRADFYCWGISGISILGSTDGSTDLYVGFFFNEDFMQLLSESDNFVGYIVPMLLGVFVVPLLLIGLFFGALSVFRMGKRGVGNTRDAFIWIIVSVVFFYIFMQFGLLALLNSSYIAFSNFYSYSIGYGLVIFSIVLIMGVYIVEKLGFWSDKGDEKSAGGSDDLERVLKERYVRGEISKDEFEQMKQDIK
jgi:uncharacterized membrane protein